MLYDLLGILQSSQADNQDCYHNEETLQSQGGKSPITMRKPSTTTTERGQVTQQFRASFL